MTENTEQYEINNILDIYKLLPLFKKDGHEVNEDWVINFKSNFLLNKSYGLCCFYKFGYFFYYKKYKSFT